MLKLVVSRSTPILLYDQSIFVSVQRQELSQYYSVATILAVQRMELVSGRNLPDKALSYSRDSAD